MALTALNPRFADCYNSTNWPVNDALMIRSWLSGAGFKMHEDIEALAERAIINLQYARAEIVLAAMTPGLRRAITHIDEALADLGKLAPRCDVTEFDAAG